MPFEPPRPKGLDLYHAWISNPSRRVRFALEEKELAWRGVEIELLQFEQHSPEYVAVNPGGMVPALVHADIHLSPFFARLNELADRGIGLAGLPRAAAWWERMQARPALARARIEPVFKD